MPGGGQSESAGTNSIPGVDGPGPAYKLVASDGAFSKGGRAAGNFRRRSAGDGKGGISSLVQDGGRPLPKFGEWDVNDPASAEGFTAIFNKARDEKKTGGNAQGADSPGKGDGAYKQRLNSTKTAKKWCCCIQASPAQS